MEPTRAPWIDLHAHPGRCFLAGLDRADPLVVLLGRDHSAAALHSARAAGLAAVSFSTVADLVVLAPDAQGGLHASRPFRPGEAYEDHQRQLGSLRAFVEREGATVVEKATDFERAHAEGETAIIIMCEGGDFLEGRLDRLAEASAAGVSALTLVHYRVNEIGDIQTEKPVHGGLTPFGHQVVVESNRLGMVIDCAHATLETTLGVLDASSDPIMISHSHLDHAERHHPRLLSSDHASAVAAAGGLVGAWPSGVTSTTLDDFVDEIIRLVDLLGSGHVAIGTDMDANYRPVLDRYEQFATLADLLARRGAGSFEIDQILGGNAVEMFRRVRG